METLQRISVWALAAGLLAPAFASEAAGGGEGPPAHGHGRPLIATTGIGQLLPPSLDVSLDAAWQVHAFERDGIQYCK
ncbi:MAG: hypothetical protein ACREO8_12570 [Luteimonas sp.]